jgi:hypothetical protein
MEVLCANPEEREPTLDDLRPLMLVEELRKIWTSILVRRIQGILGDNSGTTQAGSARVPQRQRHRHVSGSLDTSTGDG